MQPKYLKPDQIAREWGVSRQQVSKWLNARRIPGARRTTDGNGNTLRWWIPADAIKPEPLPPGRKPSKTPAKQG